MLIILKTYLPDTFSSNLLWLSVLPSILIIPWYWRGAERVETVKLLVETESPTMNKVWLKGHRDELLEYEAATGYTKDEVEE